MCQPIAKAAELRPRDFRVTFLKIGRKPLRIFGEKLQIAQHGVLNDAGRNERVLTCCRVSFDLVDTLDDMYKRE